MSHSSKCIKPEEGVIGTSYSEPSWTEGNFCNFFATHYLQMVSEVGRGEEGGVAGQSLTCGVYTTLGN